MVGLVRPIIVPPRVRGEGTPFVGGVVALLIAVAGLAGALRATAFEASPSLVEPAVSGLTILAIAAGLRRLGCPRLALGIEVAALTTAFSICVGLLSLILAGAAFPFVDADLAAWDRRLFGDAAWPAALAVARGWPRAMAWLSVIYDTLNLQPLVLIPALLLARAELRLQRFAVAWMLSLGASVAISPLTPALGTYLHFGVARASVPGVHLGVAWEHVTALAAARDGATRTIGVETLAGIVTFPSFHAAGAVLLGWAAWGCRAICAPFALLNLALFASAVFVGGHYLVDLVAGTAIAVAALWAGIGLVHEPAADQRGGPAASSHARCAVRIRRSLHRVW